jgi:hypothetical protein
MNRGAIFVFAFSASLFASSAATFVSVMRIAGSRSGDVPTSAITS